MMPWGQPFKHYPLKTRAFYDRILFLACLNLEAYNRGLVSHRVSDNEKKPTEIDELNWQIFIAKIPHIKAELGV